MIHPVQWTLNELEKSGIRLQPNHKNALIQKWNQQSVEAEKEKEKNNNIANTRIPPPKDFIGYSTGSDKGL